MVAGKPYILLVRAKTSLKQVSLSRLELCEAILLTYDLHQDDFGFRACTCLWMDSTVVLGYTRTPDKMDNRGGDSKSAVRISVASRPMVRQPGRLRFSGIVSERTPGTPAVARASIRVGKRRWVTDSYQQVNSMTYTRFIAADARSPVAKMGPGVQNLIPRSKWWQQHGCVKEGQLCLLRSERMTFFWTHNYWTPHSWTLLDITLLDTNIAWLNIAQLDTALLDTAILDTTWFYIMSLKNLSFDINYPHLR